MAWYPLGQPVTLSTTVSDTAGALADPGGLTLVVVSAAGTVTKTWPGDVVRDTAGVFHYDLLPTVAGQHVVTWTSTGANAGVRTLRFDVFDSAAYPGVPWSPDRRQVAKYVPTRTLPADEFSDIPGTDFTTQTTPTAAQADDHIAAAVTWVSTAAGTVPWPLYVQAAEVAAVRAAGMIELSYPVRDADVNTAQALLAQADAMLAGLVEANEDIGADDGGGGGVGHVLPQWAFPVPVSWGDTVFW